MDKNKKNYWYQRKIRETPFTRNDQVAPNQNLLLSGFPMYPGSPGKLWTKIWRLMNYI